MKSLSEVSSMRAPSPSVRTANEGEARKNAEALSQGIDPMSTPQSSAAPAMEGGQPLAARERTVFETRFGRDFSNVRVHTDQPAADAAEAMGARAFTYGSNIAFNSGEYSPATRAGQKLLAHELTHTMQPGEGGSPAVQMDPKKGKGGIGSEPPSESFVPMQGETGSEQGFALFSQNTADLSKDGETAILKALGEHTGSVTVYVHGYASAEGDADYNLNLSAHRAVAVKKFLEGHLPPDSRVILYAHGETKEFGTQGKNRRVGIDVSEGVATFGYKPKIGFGLDYSLDPKKQPPPLFNSKIGIEWKPPIIPPYTPPGQSTLDLTPLPPLTPRYDLMDNAGILGPFASHGRATSDLGNLHEEWGSMYWKYRRIWGLSEEWSARFANFELSGTVKSTLERDSPNAIDKSNADWKAAHPDEKATPTIWSPNLFEVFGSKDKKKDSK